ncbi:MAG: AAA family ATPase, partial [Candidatus Woesearchaeota archaeon]
MIERKTPNRPFAIPRLVFVRINGETIFQPIQDHFKDDFLIEEVPEVELLRGGSSWIDVASLFYPFQKRTSKIDISRLEMLARQHSTIPIFVGVEDDVNIKHAQQELWQYTNLRYISAKEIQDEKSFKELVKGITDVQLNTMPKGVVIIYDPTEQLKSLARRLRENKFWTERSSGEEEFLKDLAYNRTIMDAVVMDYPGPARGKKLTEEIRKLNPKVPIIALLPKSSINNLEDRCNADYPIIKTENKKGDMITPQVLYYLGRVLERVPEKEEVRASGPKTEHINKRESMVFYIMGPSAAGKTTITELVANMLGDRVEFIKKDTTRPPRPDERLGFDLNYIKSDDQFEVLKQQNRYIYDFYYRGFRYGIPRLNIMEAQKAKKHIIMVNPALEQLEPITRLFDNNGVVPILLYANMTTLKERLEKRGFGSTKEMEERLSRIDSDMNDFDRYSDRFLYMLFTDRGLMPLDNAKRLISIINWEEKQEKHPSQRSFEKTHEEYVNTIVRHLFGKDVNTEELITKKPNEIEFRFDPDVVEKYAAEQTYSGIPSFVTSQMPLKVVTTTMAYGHLGIFFNACGV